MPCVHVARGNGFLFQQVSVFVYQAESVLGIKERMDGEQSVHLGFKHIVRTGDGDGGCSCSNEGGKGSAGPVDGVGSRFFFFGFRNLCNAVGTHLNGYAGALAGVAFVHISVASDGEGFGGVFD